MLILQARMSSTRMPGKVLTPLLGEPMIVRQLERLHRAAMIDEVVVATSTDPSDDVLAETLERHGETVRRGSLDDVLARYLMVIDEFDPQVVVRITGDNPLIDPGVIDRAVREHVESGADYSSTGLSQTFPKGLDTEVVTPSALRYVAEVGPDDYEREHVTPGVFRRPERFSLHPVTQQADRSDLRWTVDYPADFEWATTVYERLYPGNPGFGQEDVIALIEREPHLQRTSADVES
jgi:spore coat polysaccharide biosynthesis protein SpsF